MPMQPVNISDTGYQMFLDDESVFAPRERGLERQAKQNALARQQSVRNALAQSINPKTGLTNYEFAQQIGGVDIAPELQAAQQADILAQTELRGKRATALKAETDAAKTDNELLLSHLQTIGGLIGAAKDETSYQINKRKAASMGYDVSDLPEYYDPDYVANLQQRTLTAQQQLTMSKPDINFQTTGLGVQGYDVNANSQTYKQPVITAPLPPKSPGVNIRMGADETEFGKTIAKDAATNLGESFKGARSANSSYSNIERLTPLLNSKEFISGTLGNTRLAVAKAFGLEGAEETQTFFSQMGRETAETIKSFGAGTGLSDNDRIYAEKIAGGNVDLTPGAIKRILFLRQQANRAAILQYNDERRAFSASNPKANLDQYYREIPVPPPPSYNYKGWRLETDAQGNSAYVSPDRKSFQETR